jgi:Cu-Zn family superoxide dismutase
MRGLRLIIISLVFIVGSHGVLAQNAGKTAMVHRLTAQGTAESIGTVSFSDGHNGLLIQPDLNGLEPGPIGLHIHENPSCAASTDGAPGMGAGSHYDPEGKGAHKGPYGDGHKGDLPVLIVEQDGSATIPSLAPHLKLADLEGRSLMVHAGKDDYGSSPGGGRAYCGIIK